MGTNADWEQMSTKVCFVCVCDFEAQESIYFKIPIAWLSKQTAADRCFGKDSFKSATYTYIALLVHTQSAE